MKSIIVPWKSDSNSDDRCQSHLLLPSNKKKRSNEEASAAMMSDWIPQANSKPVSVTEECLIRRQS